MQIGDDGIQLPAYLPTILIIEVKYEKGTIYINAVVITNQYVRMRYETG